jgi:hypothetical protein
LTADKIAIRCRNRTLARTHGFTVGGKAHRAAGLAPFETGVCENLLEPFGGSLSFDDLGARYDPRTHARGHLATSNDVRRSTEIA